MARMNSSKSWVDDNGEIVFIETVVEQRDGSFRKVKLKVGDRVKVEPVNPQKLKHRDRTGTIAGYYHDEIGFLQSVKVKFDDTKRVGKVDVPDLVPYKE